MTLNTLSSPARQTPPPLHDPGRASFFRRIWIVLSIFVLLLLLALLPPYVNVNRFQRRITTSISQSLGRPVHLDNVTLNLLPVPGFTLDNFVVGEDPTFGAEPTIRAQSVHATLRVSTLWRRRVEFSTISLTDPSINLVHTASGQWNLDSILLQAAHIDAAPTAQASAGPAPRFPYIEATGARVNLKLGNVKLPYALTDADFALWLPDPQTWHFRITSRPARTDVPLGYPGSLHVDGTLGRASTLAQIPVDLHGEWRSAPLGEISRILLGRDAGWRGQMDLTAAARGTLGENRLTARLHLEDLRRADFVPERLLSLDLDCDATAASAFHALPEARCTIPLAPSGDAPPLVLTGSLPDIRQPGRATLRASLPPTPARVLTPILQTLSRRIPPRLALGGTLAGTLLYTSLDPVPPVLQGAITLSGATVVELPGQQPPIVVGDTTLQPTPPESLHLLPTTIALGARDPAILEATFNHTGYILHLTGSALPDRLAVLAHALPQFGDGLAEALPAPQPKALPAPIRLDLTATRPWNDVLSGSGTGPQVWQQAPVRPAPAPRRTSRRHHR